MGHFFKNMSWYIMRGIHILKYFVRTQETYDEAVACNPCMLRHVPGNLITQKMCDTAVARCPCMLRHVPDNFKIQEMYDTAVRMDPDMIMVLDGVLFRFLSVLLLLVPDHIKTQGMCEKAVERNSRLLEDVPDRLLTQEMCDIAVRMEPWSSRIISDHFISQEMCDEVVARHPYTLGNVPVWFVRQQHECHWMMVIMMNLLSGTKVIKNEKHRKQK